jgi:hypothetical protein
MEAELPPLKLDRARFSVALSEVAPGPAGRDGVAFMASTNPGLPEGPLDRIASGGELSRFMLALKVCLRAGNPDATLIFDEIDRGVGGATADAVGRRLARLADTAQVLVVTHAPSGRRPGRASLACGKDRNRRPHGQHRDPARPRGAARRDRPDAGRCDRDRGGARGRGRVAGRIGRGFGSLPECRCHAGLVRPGMAAGPAAGTGRTRQGGTPMAGIAGDHVVTETQTMTPDSYVRIAATGTVNRVGPGSHQYRDDPPGTGSGVIDTRDGRVVWHDTHPGAQQGGEMEAGWPARVADLPACP